MQHKSRLQLKARKLSTIYKEGVAFSRVPFFLFSWEFFVF